MNPDDFDFPCSDTFRGHFFEHCGMPDPAESLARLQVKEDIERWGEYIINGNPPAHFSTKQDWTEAKKVYGYRVRQDVVELERKITGLNKALANHLTEKPKKGKYTYDS